MTTEATQQQASQQEEPDMDALFAEAVSTTATEEGAEKPATQPEQTESKTPSENDLDLSQNTVNKEATETTASTEAPAATKTEGTAAAADWRTALAPEVKAEVDKLEAERARLAEMNNRLNHTARSDAGRVAALTRRVDELQRSVKSTGSAAAQEREALFKKFEADYPEIAAVMKAQMEDAKAQIASTQKTAEALAQDYAQKAQAEREAAVEAAHKGWKETIKAPAFTAWLGQQPQGVRALGASDEPGDAIALLNAFRQTNPATSQSQQQTTTTTTTSTATGSGKPSKTAAEIKAERQQTLAASTAVATRATSRTSTTDANSGELEGDFNHFATKRSK
jgi:hypothetical protein